MPDLGTKQLNWSAQVWGGGGGGIRIGGQQLRAMLMALGANTNTSRGAVPMRPPVLTLPMF